MLEPRAVAAFLAQLDDDSRAGLGARAADELARAWRTAKTAWRDIPLDAERFCAALGEHARGLESLASLRVADLYLACACAEAQPKALQAFEGLLAEAAAKLRRTAHSTDLLEEAKQVTRQLLLRRGERRPAIADYAGRGDLRGWLRVALGREVVRLLRGGEAMRRLDTIELARAAAAEDDPETAYLKSHYEREFKDAFAAAVDALDRDDRRLLRYSIIERLSIDDVAKLERVHRATAARQIVRARDRLVDETRRIMAERLEIDEPQMRSVLGLIDSQVDVSVQRLLARH